MKAFWDYGRNIGLFEAPLTKIEIVRAFTVDPSVKAGFSLSGDGSLLKVASVFIVSEPDLLSELILGRLGELNNSVKQFRSRRIAEFDTTQARISLNPTIEAINAVSRGLSKFLTAEFLSNSSAGSRATRNLETEAVAKNVDDLVAQWTGVFRRFQQNVQNQPGLERYSASAALIAVWKELDIESNPRIDPASFIQRLTETAATVDHKNSAPLRKVGEELGAYYESRRPDLASSAPIGNR
jgi:hypothetical protein